MTTLNFNRKTTNALVADLKANQEDFEYYPTTEPMLDAVVMDIATKIHISQNYVSLLDIGAGDCRLAQKIHALKNKLGTRWLSYEEKEAFLAEHGISYDIVYSLHNIDNFNAIEKSLTHIQNFSKIEPKINLVGADFNETDLSSILSEISFVNPPYSTYAQWMATILSSTRSSFVYAVIPQRWQENQLIKQALKERDFEFEIIMQDDFLEADRKARAVVDVVRFSRKANRNSDNKLKKEYYDDKEFKLSVIRENENDPLAELLSSLAIDKKEKDYWEERKEKETAVAVRQAHFKENKLEGLISLYDQERDALLSDIKAIQQVRPEVLSRLGINVSAIISKLRQDLKALKSSYWNTFFDIYDPIRNRLTQRSKEIVFTNSTFATELDFTFSNCQAVTILVIEQANNYIDKQIKELFMDLADKDNLKAYKSNQRVFEARKWRYADEDEFLAQYSHSQLEYRLVCSKHVDLQSHYSRDGQNLINDFVVVARNLGFNIPDYKIQESKSGYFVDRLYYGEKYNILINAGEDSELNLFDIRFFKKGTYHIRLNQEFALRLNVAVGKLFGWLNSEDDLSELGDDIDKKYWQYGIEFISPKVFAIGFNGDNDNEEETSEDDDFELVG